MMFLRGRNFTAALTVFALQASALDQAHTFENVLVPAIGTFRGVSKVGSDVSVFAGIQYAKAPIAKNRWRRPRPFREYVVDNMGTIDATGFGPACPQIVRGSVIGDENCLTLNVYAPRHGAREAKLPVLVWLHGGSFVKGTANIGINGTWGPLYDGHALASRGAVVVTLQYRLGIFGFLGAEILRQRDQLGSAGNYGTQDQRLALQWVQKHISSFGGDPTRVLLFGQSSGACSTELHMVSPASAGLFSSVAMESGAGQNWCYQPMKTATRAFDAVLSTAKCEDVECLVKLPVEDLLWIADAVDWTAPVIDGVDLLDVPSKLVKSGNFSNVPSIIGFVRDDGASSSFNPRMTETEFEHVLTKRGIWKGQLPSVKALLSAAHSEWYWSAVSFSTEHGMGCPMASFAHALADSGANVFAYVFSKQPHFSVELLYGPNKLPQQRWGAYHGAEIAFVFGNAELPAYNASLTAEEQLVATKVGSHFLHLADKGVPQASWPALPHSRSGTAAKWLLLEAGDIAVDEHFVLPHCDFFGWGSSSVEWIDNATLIT